MSDALDHPALPGDIALVRALFGSEPRHSELRNPHVEPPVSDTTRASARHAAVLIPLIDSSSPRVLVTRRNARIRFAGHICFPGGTCDPTDATPVATALRETHEEIGLAPDQVEVLGCLGDYYTQAGYRITPVVGLVREPLELRANPAEVAEIHEVAFTKMLASHNYQLNWRTEDRAHIAFHDEALRIAGPTVSIMIGLYESLLRYQRVSWASCS